MTTKILAAIILFTGATLGASSAQAQSPFNLFGGKLRQIVDSELVAIGGGCYVRDTMSDGSIREIPCDELYDDELEDFSDDEWDDFCATRGHLLTPAQYAEYCGGGLGGYVIRLTDNIALSRFRFTLGTNYLATGQFSRGFLATEVGGSLVNPAYTLDYKMSGYTTKFGLDSSLSYDKFSPFKLSVGLEFGSLSGSGSTGGFGLDEFGAPSVGVNPGYYFVNSPTDVLGTEFNVDRSFGALSTRLSFPLMKGEYSFNRAGPGISGLDYNVYAIAGKRLGWLNQTEETFIETDTPVYGGNSLSQIRYDTQFDGGFFGLQAGLGVDKRMPLDGRDGLAIQESFSALVGYDHYRFNVTDSIDAYLMNGLYTDNTSNSFDVSAGVPTFQAMGSVGIGDGKWYAGLRAAVSAGLHPDFDYNRPDSDQAGALDPTLDLKPGWSYEFGAQFKYSF